MKKIPNGKGWFIWKIKRVYGGDPVRIAQAARAQGVSWVSIKVCDRGSSYNLRPILSAFGIEIGWKDDIIQPLIDALRAQGIAVYGWGYAYLDKGWGVSPTAEANKAVERVKQFKLDGFFIDAESQAMNQYKNAQVYSQVLRNGLRDVAIGLCSFRFPSVQTNFPWLDLLAGSDFHAPQVYWIRANNSEDQLTRSFNELINLVNMPFVPLGIAAQDDHSPWKPTAQQISAFAQRAHNMGIQAVGWYEWGDAQAAGLEQYVAVTPGEEDFTDPEDPGEDPEPVGPVGLYYVIPHFRPGTNGPAISPCNRNTKALGDGASVLNYAAWSPYLREINKYDKSGKENARLEWIDQYDGGPTKGVENGKYKWVGLAYPGNVLMVEEIVTGQDGKPWARVQCVSNANVPDPAQINYVKTPHLVHQAFGWGPSNNLYSLIGPKGGCVVPVVGDAPWYIPMSELRPIRLARGMNVRSGPGTNYSIVDSKAAGEVFFSTLSERRNINDDLWGKTDAGWIAIKVGGWQYTDWKV